MIDGTLLDALVAVVPLGAMVLGTKLHKLDVLTGKVRLHDALGFIGGDLVFLGVYLLIVILALAKTRGRLRKSLRIGIHLLSLGLSLLALSAHAYFLSTFALLDWEIMGQALRHLGELRRVLLSEVHPGTAILLGATVLANLAPIAVSRAPTPPLARSERGFWSRALLPCVALSAIGALCSAARVASAVPAARSNVYVRLTRGVIDSWSVRRHARHIAHTEADRRLSIARTADKPKRNVVLIVLESARARSTTPYDPELATTPFLAELGRRGRLVENAYTVVPHTTKALVALQCGVYPALDLDLVEAEDGGLPTPCLPRLLREQGYATAFFQPAEETFERRRELVARFGYETFKGKESISQGAFDESSYFGWEDNAILEPVLDWVDHQNRPFLLSILTLASHHPYQVPRGFEKAALASDPVLNDYLNTLRYTDAFLARLFGGFEKRHRLEDTLFIVAGDHGEGFGEHGYRIHDEVPYEEGLRVPMVLVGPEIDPALGPIRGLRQHVDVLPTVLEVLGFRAEGPLPGKSLLTPEGHEHLEFSCTFRGHCLALRDGDRKIVHHYGQRPDELFDLGHDPLERSTLAESTPAARAETAAGVRRLLDWKSRVDGLYSDEVEFDREARTSQKPPDHIPEQVEANFGGMFRFLGVGIREHTVRPGDQIAIDCYFEALTRVEPTWRVFAHLDGPSHVTLDKNSPNPTGGAQPWEKGDYFVERFLFAPRPDTPLGKYQLHVGFYQPRGTSNGVLSRAVPTGPPQMIDDARRVRASTIEVESRGVDKSLFVSRTPPDVAHPLDIRFGKAIRLLGYALERDRLKRGIPTKVQLYFQVLQQPAPTWKLFMHLVGPAEFNYDHVPVGGAYPVSGWQLGEYIVDAQTIMLSPKHPFGEYDLYVGFWDEANTGAGIDARILPSGSPADVEQRRVKVGHLILGE